MRSEQFKRYSQATDCLEGTMHKLWYVALLSPVYVLAALKFRLQGKYPLAMGKVRVSEQTSPASLVLVYVVCSCNLFAETIFV
jgi:hypothetical protein